MSVTRLLEQTFNGCCKQLRCATHTDTSEALKLVKALRRDQVYFDYETFFPVHESMMGSPTTSEMLLRTDSDEIDKQKAFQQIRNSGISPDFDLLVFAAAIRQSIEDQAGKVSINADIKTFTSMKFFRGLYTLQKDKAFAIPDENLTIEAYEGRVTSKDDFNHFKYNSYLAKISVAIDDVDPINHLERDTERMRAFRDCGANVTMIKLDGAIRKSGVGILENLSTSARIIQTYFPNTPILLEQVKTPQEAAELRHHNISYVQGFKLPHDTVNQIRSYQPRNLAIA